MVQIFLYRYAKFTAAIVTVSLLMYVLYYEHSLHSPGGACMKRLQKTLLESVKMHYKCRNNYYPRTNQTVKRFDVPDDKVSWNVDWPEYRPPTYTSASINGKPWADPDLSDTSFNPVWNSEDGNISRKSYIGKYKIVNSFPLNPVGRTGIQGRGVLGRWGPNHAADPIATRWKRDISGEKMLGGSGKPILQFVAIKRRDSGQWAIPGGMVDPGEFPSQTLQREFMEEALNSLQLSEHEKVHLKEVIRVAFSKGDTVYEGYVDDPRNTDNAWIETVAVHFHDEAGTSIGSLPLHAGDDAASVAWTDIDQHLSLYASHIGFFHEIVQDCDAHW